MQRLLFSLISAVVVVMMMGCGDNAELPTIEKNSTSTFDFDAKRQEAMEPFNIVEPYIVTNPDGTFSLNLPADEALGLTPAQLEEMKTNIRVVNDLIRAGEFEITSEATNLNLAAAPFKGLNGVVSRHWWGFILALDQGATEQLIEDLRVWSIAFRDAKLSAAIVWPFAVPVAVYQGGLFAYRQVIKLAARRGNGIFIWISWTGQAFCVLPQL